MSKKTATLLVLLIATVIFAVVGFWYYQKTNPGQGSTSDNSSFNFFPFGKPAVTTNTNPTDNGQDAFATTTDNQNNTPELAKLHKISDEPVAGGIVFTANSINIVRYIERATGHIYQVPFDSIEKDRVSITTIPQIYESLWTENGGGVLVRYLKGLSESIETFSLAISSSTESSTSAPTNGVFFPKNIATITTNPAKTSLFYMVPNDTGSIGYIANTTNSKKSQVFNSPLKEWSAAWPKEDTIALSPKPSHGIYGHLFFLNTKTNKLTKVLSRIPGLTALVNTDATAVLYSRSTQNETKLYIKSLKTGVMREMPFSTLPEKCVWAHTQSLLLFCAVPKEGMNGELPDIWYQGVVTFSDQVWKTNVETGATDLVADPDALVSQPIDVTEISLAPDDSVMTFMNKKDLTYWGLRLK
ncbi:MAG: hypothetical protein RLZZ347_844 [Candidatus Parcubacteria bacterium]|jgi:hypothetical protein